MVRPGTQEQTDIDTHIDTHKNNDKLYFPLAEERNKWKMFSHTPLGPGPEGLFFESRAQCILSVAVLLSAIADV